MGAGASTPKSQDGDLLDAVAVQNIVGSHWDQRKFDNAATDGKISRHQLDTIIAAARIDHRKFSLSEKNLAAHNAQMKNDKTTVVPVLPIDSINQSTSAPILKKVFNAKQSRKVSVEKKVQKEKKEKKEKKKEGRRGSTGEKRRRRRKNSQERGKGSSGVDKPKKEKKEKPKRVFYAIGQHVEVLTEDLTAVMFQERGTAISKDRIETGIHHFEVELVDIGSVAAVGVCSVEDAKLDVYPGDDRYSWALWSDGDLVSQGEPVDHHTQWEDGDVIRIRLDADNKCFEWWCNGKKGEMVRGLNLGEEDEGALCFCVGGRRGTEFKLIQPEPEPGPEKSAAAATSTEQDTTKGLGGDNEKKDKQGGTQEDTQKDEKGAEGASDNPKA